MFLDCCVLLGRSCYSSGYERGLKRVCVFVYSREQSLLTLIPSSGCAWGWLWLPQRPKVPVFVTCCWAAFCYWCCLAQLWAVIAHGQVCVRGTELEILENCSLHPQTMWIPGGLTEKGPNSRHGQELHLTGATVMDSGISETCKAVLSFPAIIFTVLMDLTVRLVNISC